MIIKYNDSYNEDWQEGVQLLGELYHDIRWREVIKNTYGLQPEYYVNIENDNVVGGFPAFITCGTLISLPYLSFCGVFGDFSVDELQSQTKKVIYNKNILPVPSEICKGDYVTMRLHIPQTKEDLWNLIGSKTRNLVRKGKKTNFKLEKATIDEFYPIYCKATNELGTPPHKKKLFNLIFELFGEITHVNVMRFDGNIVSCVLEMDYNGKRYDMWAFSIKKYFHLSPNMFLYYELLKNALKSGIITYDFGRSRYNEGTYYFKKQWGARPYKFEYLKYMNFGIEKVPIKPNFVKKLLPPIWSKLPRLIANSVGPSIRKYIV
jgi:hypothetical protein|tara:strand:- start:394 stop:1353 length:960 start_codon:yes stop_codon:yes gene_type:complete